MPQSFEAWKRGVVYTCRITERIDGVLAEGEGFEPPVPFRVHRFSSTQKGSDPFGKFSTLLNFSTACKSPRLNRYGPICTVVTVELLQFYYS